MMILFEQILNWSEVWALLFPMIVLLKKSEQPKYMKPVIIYVWLAFAINLYIDIIMLLNQMTPRAGVEKTRYSNNYLYNIHSIVRFVCFSYFFISLQQKYFNNVKKILPVISLVFFFVNFIFIDGENFLEWDTFSGNLLAAEAYLLLIYCMLFYLGKLEDDVEDIANGKDFWIVTGLSIYVVINFFIYLFYKPMLAANIAEGMWDFHNIAFIIFSLFLAKGFLDKHAFRNSI